MTEVIEFCRSKTDRSNLVYDPDEYMNKKPIIKGQRGGVQKLTY